MCVIWDTDKWAQQQFGSCDLGDVRRTRRLVKFASQVAADEVVPRSWITVLRCLRRGRPIETIREFFRELAGFGGHMLRKSDGEPGWITLWRGFETLYVALRAIRSYGRKRG